MRDRFVPSEPVSVGVGGAIGPRRPALALVAVATWCADAQAGEADPARQTPALRKCPPWTPADILARSSEHGEPMDKLADIVRRLYRHGVNALSRAGIATAMEEFVRQIAKAR